MKTLKTLFFVLLLLFSGKNYGQCSAKLSAIILDNINGVTGIGFSVTDLSQVQLTQFFINDVSALTPAKESAIYSGSTQYVLTDCNMWRYAFGMKGNKTDFKKGTVITCTARFYCNFFLTSYTESTILFQFPYDYCLKK